MLLSVLLLLLPSLRYSAAIARLGRFPLALTRTHEHTDTEHSRVKRGACDHLLTNVQTVIIVFGDFSVCVCLGLWMFSLLGFRFSTFQT